VSEASVWFAARTAGAPPALRTRAAEYLARIPADGTVASQLAAAATLALSGVLSRGRERSAALDLLTADSLITLALLAQAEAGPDELERFAAAFVSATAA
jgi:hypothetical protein